MWGPGSVVGIATGYGLDGPADGSMEEKVGCCYPSGLEKSLCKWDIYVPLVTKGLKQIINKQS